MCLVKTLPNGYKKQIKVHLTVTCRKAGNPLSQMNNGDLNVYYGRAESFKSFIPVFYDSLPDQEKARADRFSFESDYNCYVSLHALLRNELSKLLLTAPKLIPIEKSKEGKPYIAGINLAFSISRTNSHFAFTIGRINQFLGIDIEQINKSIDFISVSKNYFSIKEQQLVLCFRDTIDQICSFLEVWTRKESLLKAIGTGLIPDLKKIQVLEGRNYIDIDLEPSATSFSITTAKIDRTLISIASSAEFIPKFNNLSY